MGEETLFRAFMQEALCGGIAGAAPGLPAAATTAAGVAVSSVIFGWLHALTPTYFLFATGAGVLFGEAFGALMQQAGDCAGLARCLPALSSCAGCTAICS